MPTHILFFITVLYLIRRWFDSVISHSPAQEPARHASGEVEGGLTHRIIHITQTRQGKPTDVTFHYVESAATEREHIVFLHGFMDTWKLWQHSLTALAQDYHVVAFDLKGCGQSSMNYPQGLFPEIKDCGGDYQLMAQADEIITAINSIGIHCFTLVTLDLGTIIGDVLAGAYPDHILRYIRCQQPLVGHFRGTIPQGQLLRRVRSARWLTSILEKDPSSLLRVIYGKTSWSVLDQQMKRTQHPMTDALLHTAVLDASYAFQHGPRQGMPGTFACAWAGLYQHNQNYEQFVHNNLAAYQRYSFPVFLFQGIHDIAMPPERFDGTTGMAFKISQSLTGQKILRSRAFDCQGNGLGNGYEPWGSFIPGCCRPMTVQEFFPNAPSVKLEFFDTGHFIPLENPEVFTEHLVKVLQTS